MAEVRKKEKREEYKIEKEVKSTKKTSKAIKKEVKKQENKKTTIEKKSLWVRFRIFCHGVKSETLRVHWPSKKEMTKYSIATIVFVVFCSLFFYLINVIFAFVQSVLN